MSIDWTVVSGWWRWECRGREREFFAGHSKFWPRPSFGRHRSQTQNRL